MCGIALIFDPIPEDPDRPGFVIHYAKGGSMIAARPLRYVKDDTWRNHPWVKA